MVQQYLAVTVHAAAVPAHTAAKAGPQPNAQVPPVNMAHNPQATAKPGHKIPKELHVAILAVLLHPRLVLTSLLADSWRSRLKVWVSLNSSIICSDDLVANLSTLENISNNFIIASWFTRQSE